MENFSLFYSNDEDAIMSYSDIRNFQQAWNIIDVNRKGMVKAYYVRFLLRLIPRDRVGFDLSKKRDKQLFKEMCYEVETLRGGRDKEVSFHDILMVLAYRTVDITKTLQLEELIAREDLEYAIEEEVARQTIATWIERCIFRKRQKHGSLHFSMHSGSDRPTNGHFFEDSSKEPSATNTNKSSLRIRSSKIKFSREEVATLADSMENPPSASSTNQSPPTSPTQQQEILSPVATTIRATDCAVARMAGFQNTSEPKARVNGRLDHKFSQKNETHIPDGLLPNCVGNKTTGSIYLTQTTFPTPSILTFVDSCTKSKQLPSSSNPSETETHKPIQSTAFGGATNRRRSMRSNKSHIPLLSGEDTDQISRHSLFFGTGMPAIQEAGPGLTKNSTEMNEPDGTPPGLSIPTEDKQFLESGTSSLSEHAVESFDRSGMSDGSKVSPYREKRGRVSNDELVEIAVSTLNVVHTSCQDVKSWWMQQIHSDALASNSDGLEKSAVGGGQGSKEPSMPSFVMTGRQGGAVRGRRRGHHGCTGRGIDGEPESTSFSGAKRRYLNEPVA